MNSEKKLKYNEKQVANLALCRQCNITTKKNDFFTFYGAAIWNFVQGAAEFNGKTPEPCTVSTLNSRPTFHKRFSVNCKQANKHVTPTIPGDRLEFTK